MRMGPIIALVVLFSAACAGAAEPRQQPDAAVFHLAPDGDDSGPGSRERPWRTLEHAAEMVRPGVTISLHAGTYAESVTFETSGNAEAPIVVAGAPIEKLSGMPSPVGGS